MIDIIIVDDERSIREGIATSIPWQQHDINICAVASGVSEALDLIETYMPNIIISDISMPEMSGLDLLEIVNRTYPNIKVILISGYRDFEYAQRAVTNNAFCYLTKPLVAETLIQKVLEAKQEIDAKLKEVKLNDNIRRKLRENIMVLKDNFFRMLMEGRMRQKSDIIDRAATTEIDINFTNFIVCVAEFELAASQKKLNMYDFSFYKAAIMSTIEENLVEIYKCYTFNLDNRIGILVCSNQQIQRSILVNKLNNVKSWVNKNMGFSLSAGIGNTCGSIEKVTLSYISAVDAMLYRVILGKNIVVDAEQKINTSKEKMVVDDFDNILKNSEEDIVFALRNMNQAEVKNIIEQIMQSSKHIVANDVNQKERIAFLLSVFIIRVMYSLEISNHRFYNKENDLYNSINELISIDDMKNFILGIIREIFQAIEESDSKQNNFLVNKGLRYIKEGVYEDVSLVTIAERLQIHPNYLSKIFKQVTDESFTEHVIRFKMNEAKKLLKTTNAKVYEISDKLGYKDVAHFTKLFKKHFGISPTEYRQLL
ncbi:MAG: response regulator [Clostridiaceae bacterium]|nr:response regulator [Clostridia bacterium]NLV34843.1 response regulator [Clostridiaceae bacterium]HPB16200.1 response regulator [Clostridia bacterium]HQO68808.1 response regulator [Clostridia bacterium]